MAMNTEEVRRLAPPLAMIASMAPPIAAAMIEAFEMVPLSADDRRYLVSPIVVHEAGGWGAAHIPDWMPPQIRMERAEIVLGLHEDWLVGPTEIVAVMHAASLAAPLDRDAGDLYVWASIHAMARKTGKTVEETWHILHPVGTNQPVTTDDMVLQPRGRLYHTYVDISRVIRRKVERIQQERDRAERRSTPS